MGKIMGKILGNTGVSIGRMTTNAIASPAGAHPMDAIARSLDHDWSRLVRRARTAGTPPWAEVEPELRGYPLGEIPSLVRWSGYRATPRGAAVLSALLRQAGEPLAARALLQALVPRLRSENVYTPTFGHRLAERAQEPSDTAADLVAECFAAIARHAGEDRGDVDRLLVQQAVRRLRTARQGVHRYQARTAVLPATSTGTGASGPDRAGWDDLFSSARTGPEWLATAVVEAARRGLLGLDDARLIYAARVQGLPASEVGRRHGFAPRAVYHALARAERALLQEVA